MTCSIKGSVALFAFCLVICSLGDRSSKIREIYESQFRQFDMNEDSVIDAQEIRSNFPDLANDHIDSFFRSTDGNKDGLRTVSDVDAETMSRFDDQMQEMDLDGNGIVDAQEIRSVFLGMSDSFIDGFMRRIDKNQDGSCNSSSGTAK
ncbi:hypothetical protein FOL47_000113 [Perkinsus chesapeaki]|uniref:EF-hand domain-containing protein n=1 Tax=Perkinsus chesapeaki TaxID=330153 RepID=A0A7J6N1A8_PERCH|nr:hypothetical protein FOL47_000113 [Perkinsus chesapeaki]